MIKKINKIELAKITDGTSDISKATFDAALALATVTSEYEYEQFLIANGWQEYHYRDLNIGEPKSTTWKNTKANPVQNAVVNSVTTAKTSYIKLYPIPDTSPEYYLLKIYYMKEPAQITATTDILELPESAKDALKYYAAAQALLAETDLQDYNKANTMLALYEQAIKAHKQTIKAQQYQSYEIGYRS